MGASSSLYIVASLITTLSLFGLDNVGACDVTKAAALFVFGDSYADTGNHNASVLSLATPWRTPYGLTWPEKPYGRFSDGRVLTDIYASYLGVRTPVPYAMLNIARHEPDKHIRHRHTRGINFAFGGSGVFPTFGPRFPNISVQISQLQHMINRGLVSKKLIKDSMVLLVIAGNDYSVYSHSHPNYQGIIDFIAKVVGEMAILLEALHKVGFKMIGVTNLAPVGCLPGVTYLSNYTSCNETINLLSSIHNTLLSSHISSLQAKHPDTHFLTVDLHSAFETVISGLPLTPCCNGIGKSNCGDVDKNGQLSYTKCSYPDQMFFWDHFHPTNAAWQAISKALFSK